MNIYRLISYLYLVLNIFYFGIKAQEIIPNYVMQWVTSFYEILPKDTHKVDTNEKLETIFLKQINIRYFIESCVQSLQSVIIKYNELEDTWIQIDDIEARNLCDYFNPLTSSECSSLSIPALSMANSVQEFVSKKSNNGADIKGACLLVSDVAPVRPFGPLARGYLAKKCEKSCQSTLGLKINKYEGGFCKRSLDLCRALDFTLASSFKNMSEQEFGLAVAIANIVGEVVPNTYITFRDGCRYISYLKNLNLLPISNATTETIIGLTFSEYFVDRFYSLSMISQPSNDQQAFLKSRSNQLVALEKEIYLQMVSILSMKLNEPSKLKNQNDKKTQVNNIEKKVFKSSKLKEDSYNEMSQILSDLSLSFNSPVDENNHLSESQRTIAVTLAKYAPDDSRMTKKIIANVVELIDSDYLYSSCVNAFRQNSKFSMYQIKKMCAEIDPFKSKICSKVNLFDLQYLITLKKSMEEVLDTFVDLRDLCNDSNNLKPSELNFIKKNDLYKSCVSGIKGGFLSRKYSLDSRTVNSICKKADFTKDGACERIVNRNSETPSIVVLQLARNLVNSKINSNTIQKFSDNSSLLPKYSNLCRVVRRMYSYTISSCIDEIKSEFQSYSLLKSMDIDFACRETLEEIGSDYSRKRSKLYYDYDGDDIYSPYIDDDYRVEIQYRGIRPTHIKHRHRNIPYISLYPWIESTLPTYIIEALDTYPTQYSDARKGLYMFQDGSTGYFDGFRHRFGGKWWIKIGTRWFIDESTDKDYSLVRGRYINDLGYPFYIKSHFPKDNIIIRYESTDSIT